MSTQWNEETIPSLTLEPDLNDAPELAVAEETAMQQTQPEAALTPEEQKIVDDFAAKIDVENTTQILQYGAGTQKKMADFSDTALANVRTQDLGEVGDLITSVVGELKGFDAEEEKGLFGFFRKQAMKAYDIALFKQVINSSVLESHIFSPIVIHVRIIQNYMHSKAAEEFRHGLSDFSGTDDSGCEAIQLASCQAIKSKVSCFGPQISLRKMSCQG